MRRWPAWRLGDEPRRACSRPTPGSPTRRAATSPIGASRPSTARRSATGPRSSGIEDAGDGEVDVVLEDGERLTAGRVILAADAWTQRPARAARRSPAAHDHPGAGALVHAARSTRRCSRPSGSRSGSGWTSRRSTASRPTGTRGRRSGRTSAAARSRRRRARSSADEDALARVDARSSRRTCRAWPASRSSLKTCLYTLTPDRDFVVDAAARAPGRARAARLGARLQVRVASSAGSSSSCALDGSTPSDRSSRRSGSTARSCAIREPRVVRFVL